MWQLRDSLPYDNIHMQYPEWLIYTTNNKYHNMCMCMCYNVL